MLLINPLAIINHLGYSQYFLIISNGKASIHCFTYLMTFLRLNSQVKSLVYNFFVY